MNPQGNAEKLSKLLNHSRENVDADAAVVILLREEEQGFQILLVKRAEKSDDPWSGQTALPGGKRNPEDRNLMETVVRETLEETCINLLEGCRFLGTIEPLRSTQRPEMMILPFVVMLEQEQTIKLNEELTEYLWTPLKKLPHQTGTAEFSFGEYPAYIVEDHVVWGLTYRILESFFSILESS